MQAMKTYTKNRGTAPLILHCDKVKEIRMYGQITNHLNTWQKYNDWERH